MQKRQVPVGSFILQDEEINAVVDVLKSQRISEGPKTREFEKLFAEYVGTKYCVAVNSGTSALIVALLALLYDERFPRVKKGAKVITSPLTYVATSNAIVLTGMEPVFLDIDPLTFEIKPETLEKYLASVKDIENYALVLPVHLMGYPNDMEKINKIAAKYGLLTFEDSAQAHGTKIGHKNSGACSLVSDFSFYIAHNIQAGEMGAVTTDDEKIYKLVKKLKANGRLCDCMVCTRSQGVCPYNNADFDPRFVHEYISYNFKTMDTQAALAISQVKKADDIFKKRQQNVKELLKRLSFLEDVLQLPKFDEKVSYLAFPMVIKDNKKYPREQTRRKLEKLGVENRPLFGCIPTQQPAYGYLKKEYDGNLPNADYAGANGFYIGCHQYLTKEDIDYIEFAFKEVFASPRPHPAIS